MQNTFPNYQPPKMQPTGQFSPADNPFNNNQPTKANKRLVFIIVIGAVILVSILTLALLANTSQSTTDNVTVEEIMEESQAPSLDPASAVMLNQANASISQELSTMNDAEDFSDEPLSDKTLGL